MQLRKNTAAVVFLVLQWSALVHSDGLQDGNVHQLNCTSNKPTLTCSLAKADLHGSQNMKLDVRAEQTVEIRSSESSSESSTPCFWAQGETSEMLPIKRFERDMDGVYTAVCGNGNSSYSVHISVHVVSPERRPSVPQITVTGGGQSFLIFKCTSEGSPVPSIAWYENKAAISSVPEQKIQYTDTTVSAALKGFSFQNSNIKCCASNSQGEECALIYHYDLDNSANETEAPQIFLKPGQSLALRCTINDPEETLPLKWYFNNTKLSGLSTDYYSQRLEYFSIKSVSEQDSGEYVCKSKDRQTKATQVQVYGEDFIDILELKEDVRIWEKAKASFCFKAKVRSYPKTQCRWITPNGAKVQSDKTAELWNIHTFELCNPEPGQYQIQLTAGGKFVTKNMSLCVTDTPKFTIQQELPKVTCMTKSTSPQALSWKTCPLDANCSDSTLWKETRVDLQKYPDSGQFCHKEIVISKDFRETYDHFIKCCLTNKDGLHCSERILVKIPPIDSMALIVMCMLVIALVLVSLTLVYFICKKKPRYETQLQVIQMVGTSDNDYIYIDFRDFKYDQKWEFPRENLELGKMLGSGAFGMVVQATAYGISKPGESMQVAVKMLKDKHQDVEREALMSELKMLTHIGQHANIVNLLGACTGTGPIYLIFQYCCHGDLLNFLKNNREHFYKCLTDAFNKNRFSGLYQNYQRKRNSSEFGQSDDISYMHMAPVTKEREALLSTSTNATEEIFLSDDEDQQTLTYDDLLSFSYQVAKGMEFLSSKNCIHRDLAARNVLVTQGRLVKIGDFGLARDIENDSNYVVRGNARLPVKWMAPESIFNGMYTMQSDVWAYGILLWEIFSLGVTPYPGIKVDNTFYAMIERGFQMEMPYYATEPVYKVMCRCWALEPRDRPCFSKLLAFMEYQLTDVEEQLYYNTGAQKNNDSIYKNAPATLQLVQEDDACQPSLMDSSGKTETSEEDTVTDAQAVETETRI